MDGPAFPYCYRCGKRHAAGAVCTHRLPASEKAENAMLTTFADDSERSALALHADLRRTRPYRRWRWDGQCWHLTEIADADR